MSDATYALDVYEEQNGILKKTGETRSVTLEGWHWVHRTGTIRLIKYPEPRAVALGAPEPTFVLEHEEWDAVYKDQSVCGIRKRKL